MDMKTSPLAQLNDPSLLKTDALINGQWVAGPSRFAVTDPATGAHLADVANLGPTEAEQAIAAANAAWPAWKAKTAKERSIILRKWYDLLMANQDDLGRIMTAEQGKPLPEAKGEVAYGASFVEWFAEEAKRINGETLPQFDNNRRLMVLKQPIGVCAAITPWNFPLAMITRKVAPALAAGCPVIIKPAELTPLTALAAAELAIRAGIPAGVLNMVTADSDNSIAVGKVLAGGKRLNGQFFEPTVVSEARADMLCAKEETFGPFAPIFKFKTEQEAIDAANNTEFGLASYFYSRDVGRIFRVSEALEYGMVGINVGILATEHVPFGGVKQSGLGREGSHHGIDDYVEIKYLCVGDILK